MRARLRPRVELRPVFCECGRERVHRVGMRLNANESLRYRKASIERNHCRRLRIAGDRLRRCRPTPMRRSLRTQAFDGRWKAIGMRRARCDVSVVAACVPLIPCRRSEAVRVLRQSRARAAPGDFGGRSHSTGYDGGNRVGKYMPGAVVDWRHSTNSRHFACFFFFSRFDKP
ncbi:hypothetical protein [Burkholderia cenocepacia]|uniref:hypothetical protein n=1 Tax=Burkholderia cenocepacia TaxID=95486 RepID=UPI002010E82C|nr:hypothetical protein [Burkholderia cenocepacia]